MLLIGLIIFCCYGIYRANGSCELRGSVQPVDTQLGEHVTLVCYLRTCKQPMYNFYHVTKNHTTVLVHRGRHRVTLNVNSYDDSGEYYCTKQCSGGTDQDEDQRCWFNIRISTEIQYDLPEAVNLYEEARGSCTFTGNPVPSSDLICIKHCKHQYVVTVIDQYTVRVNFTIYSATKLCRIHCHTTSHAETRKLHIIDSIENSKTHTSMSKSTATFTPTPTRTISIDQSSPTHSLTYDISSLSIQPTVTMSTTKISEEQNVITGEDSGSNNSNTGMVIAVLILVVLLLIVALLNLMLNIKNWKRQESKC